MPRPPRLADARPLLALAMALLDRRWQPGYRYDKARVSCPTFMTRVPSSLIY